MTSPEKKGKFKHKWQQTPKKEKKMTLSCGCEYSYQDGVYGYRKRHHNKMVKLNMYRCTVCGKERSCLGEDKPKEKAK